MVRLLRCKQSLISTTRLVLSRQSSLTLGLTNKGFKRKLLKRDIVNLSNNTKFIEALKEVENSKKAAERRGTYKNVQGEWRWFTDKSPEGGLPTLAYGHKLTPQEWNTKR